MVSSAVSSSTASRLASTRACTEASRTCRVSLARKRNDTSIGSGDIRFPFRSVVNAKLVLTDKLINENAKTRTPAQQEK